MVIDIPVQMKRGIILPANYNSFINFGFIELVFVLNIIINVALLIMVFRYWKRNFGVFG